MYIKAKPGDNPAASIWYIIENDSFRNIYNKSMHRIVSEDLVKRLALYPMVINQEPLTRAEAEALLKLLTGVQS